MNNRTPSFRFSSACLIALLLARVAPAARGQEAKSEAALTLREGEIRLEGVIEEVDWEANTLTMQTTSFSLPNGKTSQFAAPKPKRIILSGDAALTLRGAPNTQVPRTDVRSGVLAMAAGRDMGSGKPLSARALSVWSRVKDGRFVMEPTPTGPVPAPVTPEAAAPEPVAPEPALATVNPPEQIEWKNGDFELVDAALRPTDWPVPPGDAVQFVEDEAGNHFVRLHAKGDFETRKISRTLAVSPTWKTLKVSARMRGTNIRMGANPWDHAHIAVTYYDSRNQMLAWVHHLPLITSSDWKKQSNFIEVPEGAVKVVIYAGNMGAAGEFDVDDLTIEPNGSVDAFEIKPGFLEGTFEDVDDDGAPAFRPIAGMKNISVEDEAGNRFLRLVNADRNLSVSFDTFWNIPPGTRSIRLSARLRGRNIVTGPAGWQTGRVGVAFANAAGAKVGEWPPSLEVPGDTEWTRKQVEFPVPPGAVLIKLTPNLLNASGTLDIDDIVIEALR